MWSLYLSEVVFVYVFLSGSDHFVTQLNLTLMVLIGNMTGITEYRSDMEWLTEI